MRPIGINHSIDLDSKPIAALDIIIFLLDILIWYTIPLFDDVCPD